MGFGGGLYTEQNKTLPGAYFKFKSASSGITTYATRGVVGLIAPADWADDAAMRLVIPDLEADNKGAYVWPRDAKKAIGHDAYMPLPASYSGASDLAAWLPIFVREIFRNASACYIYPLMGSNKAKASCKYATAAKYGTRGNDLSLKIVADGSNFVVTTMLDGETVDEQTVAAYSDLAANAWVAFDKTGVDLAAEAAVTFEGGISGTATQADAITAVDALGNLGVNVVVPLVELTDAKLYDAFVAQNEKYGHWMQLVAPYNSKAFPEGGSEYVTCPDVANSEIDTILLCPWVAGAESACDLGGTLDNRAYDGEIIDWLVNNEGLKPPTQEALTSGMKSGYMMLHTVGTTWGVLNDDNTLIEYTETKDEAFHRNQTIRVLQTLANDWYAIFTNEFLGKAGTDESDRTNYKMRLVKSAQNFEKQSAIRNFDSKDITVSEGEQSDSYYVQYSVQPNYCARKVYHDITVAAFNS